MKPELWRQVDEVLADALDMPTGEREEFIQRSLAALPEARDEAMRLATGNEAAEEFFEKSPLATWSGLCEGARIGPWELLRPLGAGGMGIVWLAKRADGQVEMQAAIKVLPVYFSGPLLDDNNLLRRFVQEKQILARLRHPNIATLLEASAGTGELPNFVMEYVDGVSLLQYLKENKPSLAQRLRLFQRVCDAVQYAHSQLIIHRDLKPSNILVQRDGQPKLLDFGIAKVLSEPGFDDGLTAHRAFSLDYASPEQIFGNSIGTASDIYSLGLLLFEMLTGKRARRWNDRALGEVLDACQNFELPPDPGIEPDTLAVARMASAVDPQLRYKTVAELSQDTGRLIAGWPVQAKPASAFYRTKHFLTRYWLATLAAVLAVTLAIVLAAWGLLSASAARSNEATARRQTALLQQALDAESAERRHAEQQTALAQKMGEIAGINERDADKQLRKALAILESVIGIARFEVSKLEKGTQASIRITERALLQLEALDAGKRAEANYVRLKAEAYGHLAEMYGGFNGNLGDAENRDLYLNKAIELQKTLVKLEPNKLEWQAILLESEFRLAYARRRKSPILESEWRQFEIGFESIAAKLPNDYETNLKLANFYFFRATSNSASPATESRYLRSIGEYERAQKLRPTDIRTLRYLALAHKYLVPQLSAANPNKRYHAEEAVRIDQLRVAQDPASTEARLDLTFSLNTLADVEAAEDKDGAALPRYLEGYAIRKALLAGDPQNAFLLRSLTYPVRAIGKTYVVLKDWAALKELLRVEVPWVKATARPATSYQDESAYLYWEGQLALHDKQTQKACDLFRSVKTLIAGKPPRTLMHVDKDVDRYLRACPVP